MTPVLESLLNKLASLHICNFVKKRLQHKCFPAKFARTPILKNICELLLVCVRVCVRACQCVCLYSSTCWFLLAARHLWHTWDIRINDLLLWVLLVASAKFLHLHFRIYHISPPKTETLANSLLERKRYDIMCSMKRWYILIYDISRPRPKADKWRKDTKDKGATLI